MKTKLILALYLVMTALAVPHLLAQVPAEPSAEAWSQSPDILEFYLEEMMDTLPVEDPELKAFFEMGLRNLYSSQQKTGSCTATAVLSGSNGSGCGPFTVSFNAAGSSCGGNGCSLSLYLFDPGDGSTPVWKSSSSWQHNYGTSAYTAKLHILCSDGSFSAVDTQTILGNAPAPQIISLTFSNNSPLFQWQAIPGATSYSVQRIIGTGSSSIYENVYSGSATSYHDIDRARPAPSSGPYKYTYYQVKAIYPNCASDYSSWQYLKTIPYPNSSVPD